MYTATPANIGAQIKSEYLTAAPLTLRPLLNLLATLPVGSWSETPIESGSFSQIRPELKKAGARSSDLNPQHPNKKAPPRISPEVGLDSKKL